MFYVKRSEYCEIAVVFGLTAYNHNSAPKAQSGGDNVALTDYKNTIVFLYFENGLFIAQPITSFTNINTDTNGNGFFELPVMLAGQNIVWSKSYVQLLGTVTNYQNHSFIFNVYYTLN